MMTAFVSQDTLLIPVGCGVIRSGDDRLLRTARLGGRHLEIAPPAELVAMWARISDTLRDLGPGWSFFVQTSRGTVQRAPVVPLLSSGAQLLVTEDDCAPTESDSYCNNIYYLSFVLHWFETKRAGNLARECEAQPSSAGAGMNASLEDFINRTDAALRTIEEVARNAYWLCEEEAIKYSRSTARQRTFPWFEVSVAVLLLTSCGAVGGFML
jgi:type IV secretory pathway VirB4 component